MALIKKEVKQIGLRIEERDLYKTLIKGKYNFQEFFRLEVEKFLDLNIEVFSLPAPPLRTKESNTGVFMALSPKIKKAIENGRIPSPIGKSIRKIMIYQTRNIERKK